MTADRHEALIRAYIDEVFNGHRLDGLEKYWDDDLTSNWLGMETIRGLPAWRTGMEGFFAAFPDAAYILDDMFSAEDRGVWRGHWRATRRGQWQGIAASGRSVTWTVIIIGSFEGGKLKEDWASWTDSACSSSSDASRPGRRWQSAIPASTGGPRCRPIGSSSSVTLRSRPVSRSVDRYPGRRDRRRGIADDSRLAACRRTGGRPCWTWIGCRDALVARPDVIFAVGDKEVVVGSHSRRPLQTVTPLAAALKPAPGTTHAKGEE